MSRVVRSAMSWPGMRSVYAWLPPHAAATTTGTDQIGVAFSGHTGLVRETDGRAVRTDVAPGAVYVTGPAPITWVDVQDTTEALEIYPDSELVRRSGGFDVEPTMAAHDSVVFGIACVLRRAHVGGQPLTDVEGSTLAHRLVQHLHVGYGTGTASRGPVGILDRQIVDRVADYVDAHLDTTITLDALARVVSLSPFHFARAFQRTTGLPPHAFVNARRLEVAKRLLLGSRATVNAAAYAVSFSNVSHFRRLFRRQFGVNPGELRV